MENLLQVGSGTFVRRYAILAIEPSFEYAFDEKEGDTKTPDGTALALDVGQASVTVRSDWEPDLVIAAVEQYDKREAERDRAMRRESVGEDLARISDARLAVPETVFRPFADSDG